MNANSPVDARRDGLVTAVGLFVLLIGTATGNALAMLAISLIGLVVVTILWRGRFGQSALIAMGVGALIAIALAIAIVAILH